MSGIHLYSGFVKTIPDKPFKFEVDEIEIEKVYEDGTIETKYPYFTSNINSTRYFYDRHDKLDVVCEINNNMWVIYSTDKQKCINFVTSKRKSVSEMTNNLLYRLRQSEIVDLTNGAIQE